MMGRGRGAGWSAACSLTRSVGEFRVDGRRGTGFSAACSLVITGGEEEVVEGIERGRVVGRVEVMEG